MNLSDLLQEGLVLLDFEAKDKWEAIDRMVDRLVEQKRLKPDRRKLAIAALVAREKIASTGMGNGVALPHASVDAVDQAVAAIAISPKGIPFQAPDGKPATLLILLIIPRSGVQQHVRTLAGIARLLNYEESRAKLVAAKTENEVLGIIKAEEAEG